MTPAPDFRALCKELLGAVDTLYKQEPPTDLEIEEWADAATEVPLEAMDPDIHGWQRCFTKEEFCASIRAALEMWGNYPVIPDSSIHTPLPHL